MLVLVRGIPGSGKSTIARSMRDFYHYEADMFFIDRVTGEYCFNPILVNKAHQWCQLMATKALEENGDVVVSNTFSQWWEMEPYLQAARKYNHEVVIITALGAYQNVHNVPTKTIRNMIMRWEP